MKKSVLYTLLLIVAIGYSQNSDKILGNYSGSEKCNKGIYKNIWSDRYSIKITKEEREFFIVGFYYKGSKEKIKINVTDNSFSIPKQNIVNDLLIYGIGKLEPNPNFAYLSDPEYIEAIKEIDYEKYEEALKEKDKHLVLRIDFTVIVDSQYGKIAGNCEAIFDKEIYETDITNNFKGTKLEDLKFKHNGDYRKYCNKRFDYCIDYLKNFVPQKESSNQDGQVFLSNDKKAKIRTYGAFPIEGVNNTLKDEYILSKSNYEITYEVIKNNWFIISGFNKDGEIFYRKTRLKKIRDYLGNGSNNVFQTLMITYPKNQSKLYSKYCEKIHKSLN